jgi:hypothetical protein
VTLTSSAAIRHDLILSDTNPKPLSERVTSVSSSTLASSEEKIFA